jgi:hypothetical protein
MAIFAIECDGTLIKKIKADIVSDKGELFIFKDEQRNTVGSVVKKPGMTVVKDGHDADEQ